MSDKPRMLWVARDSSDEGCIAMFFERPQLQVDGATFDGDGVELFDDMAAHFSCLQPGECRMFVEFAPRVAGEDLAEAHLVWSERYGEWTSDGSCPGDIILPMPQDPTPYLTPADPKAARRDEICAQIAALQEELEGMEG